MNKMHKTFKSAIFIIFYIIGQSITAQVTYFPFKTDSDISAQPLVALAVGATGGSAEVASGTSSYSIPIMVSLGTNGAVPSLSVTYNSMGGNGILGMGWSLSGMSMISRSTKSIYHNAKVEGVNLDNNDPFVMDGARLINTNGNNGENETEYKTEAESFSIITSYTTANIVGPTWFKVTTKDGSIMEFGNTSNSRGMSQNNDKVLFWKLNKTTDPSGNYIEYVYDTSSDHQIIQINYTGNLASNPVLVPYNSVQFEYQDRTDANILYEAGFGIPNNKLLSRITTTTEGYAGFTKTYEFKYAFDKINSYLVEVKETGSITSTPQATDYLNSTIFKYGGDPVLFDVVPTSINFGGF